MKAWNEFLENQKKVLGTVVVERWLKPLKIIHFDARNLYLESKDHFQALWFEEHIRPKAERELRNNNGAKITIHLAIHNQSAKPKTQRPSSRRHEAPMSPKFTPTFDQLNHFYTFQSLLVAEENKVTDKILNEIVNAQKKASFNPIFLTGPPGSGKTHRLMAIAHALQESGNRVIYVRGKTFADHVVSAIRSGEMSTFRHYYRTADALIIDDITLLSGKKATQEEFFHTFNALHLGGKQIILADRSLPSELKEIEPRLTSRFGWGLTLELSQLAFSSFPCLLKQRCSMNQFPLSQEAIKELSNSFSSNPTNLVRALEALILIVHDRGREFPSSTAIPASTIKRLLSKFIVEEEKLALTPDRLLQAISKHFGISKTTLSSTSQKQDILVPRQLAIYLMRELLNLPYAKIGSILNRDHSTIMTSYKKILRELKSSNQEIHAELHQIEKKLYTI